MTTAVIDRRPWALGWLRGLIGAPASRLVGGSVFALIVLMCIFVPVFYQLIAADHHAKDGVVVGERTGEPAVSAA